VVPGPYTLGRLTDPGSSSRESVTLAYAEALNEELKSLVEAGCLLIQVNEDAAVTIGDDESERFLFREAHRRLLTDLENPELVHRSLAVSGGSAAGAGAAMFFDLPYHSYFYDLVNGPENLELILQAPVDRGVICGAADAASPEMDDVETLVYAMAWAAKANDRGSTRVAIAPSGSLAQIPRHYARRKLELLALTLTVATAGPVADVADALEPNPATSRQYPALAHLAKAYEAARAALGLPPGFSSRG
jgi:methionine synthase II (cobalamin-independent)